MPDDVLSYRLRRSVPGWLGAWCGAGLLAACVAEAPLPPVAPALPPGSPVPTAVSAPTPSPVPVLASERLAPGSRLGWAVPAQARRVLLLANPSDQRIVLGAQVFPAGDGPSPAPVPTPTGGRRPSLPFGFSPDRETFRGLGFEAPRRLNAVPERLPDGAVATFWINDGSATLAGDEARSAREALATAHARFFVDEADRDAVPREQLQALAEAFERRIRAPLTRVFGEEDNPGVDGDPRLYIVLSDRVGRAEGREGMMGYFWPRDPLPADPQATDLRRHANGKEVLFLSTRILEQPDVTALGTLAHEYQHLLMFCAKTRIDGVPRTEATWLDEGCAMLAMDLAGLGRVAGDPFVLAEISAYMNAPGRYSLTDWASNPDGRSYGLSYMFVRYLTGRFGLSLIEALQRTPRTGIAALEEVLRARGTSAAAVWLDWLQEGGRALVADEPGRGPVPERLSTSGTLSVRPWGGLYLEVAGLPDADRQLTLMNPSGPVAIWRGAPGNPGGELTLPGWRRAGE